MNTIKIIRNVSLAFLIVGLIPLAALARATTTDDTATAVAAGQQIWQQLQAKQTSCSNLSDTNFENLGEYFMNQMMGSSHEAMNQVVVSHIGQSGEEQMHIVMGKRLSGCSPQATYPAGIQGFMPMMGGTGMMGGYGYYGSMMGFGGGILGDLVWLAALVVLILAGVWLWQQITKK